MKPSMRLSLWPLTRRIWPVSQPDSGLCSHATTSELRAGSSAGSLALSPLKKASLIRVTASGEIAFTATP